MSEAIDFRKAKPATVSATREMPASEEAEQHVLACCLLDGSDTITRCESIGMTPDWYYWPANQILFQTIQTLHRSSPPVTLEMLAQELMTRRQIDAVGGFNYLMQVTGKIPTTAHAGYFIDKVRETHFLREIIKMATGAVEQAYSFSGGLEEFVGKVEGDIRNVINLTHVADTPLKALPDFKLPPRNDAKVLLGENRYISKGDSAILVSTSGMGKSSLSLQAATLWALGRRLFGIKTHRPLRILIIQAEDSEGDIAEVWLSIMHKLQLSPEEIAQVRERVMVVRDKINRGPAFIANMETLAAKHEPDIIIINPLQNYVKGEVTDKTVLGDFLYEGLNRANKHDKWAYFIVHHTTKPATGKDRTKRNWNEVMYDMAGASTLIDWARAILILKATAKKGEFTLNLAKRGSRAGVVKKEGMEFVPTTVIPLQHATGSIDVEDRKLPLIYWDVRDADENEPETPEEAEKVERAQRKAEEAAAKKKRTPVGYSDDELVSYFPANSEPGQGHNRIASDVHVGCGMSKSAFANRKNLLREKQLIVEGPLGQWRRTEEGDKAATRYLETRK